MRAPAGSTAPAQRSPVGRLFSPYQMPPVTRWSSLVTSMADEGARVMPARSSSGIRVSLHDAQALARAANGDCRRRLRWFFLGAMVDAERAHLLVEVAALELELARGVRHVVIVGLERSDDDVALRRGDEVLERRPARERGLDLFDAGQRVPDVGLGRSEERRVGKECRSRWSP